MRGTIRTIAGCALALLLSAVLPAGTGALTTRNNTPFPSSNVISGAWWTSARHDPPKNQFGDILPIPWADDGNLYVLIDDGGTDAHPAGALWRNSFAQIMGAPLHLRFRRIGASPPPATWPQIRHNPTLWTGPLGPYYAAGFAVFNNVFFATQVTDWQWNANGPFLGLTGVAYSTDHGGHWQFPSKAFAGPTGNLNWVQYGQAKLAPDGYVYAIATEREFNASTLILGRARPDIADLTDPTRWQWASAPPLAGGIMPQWSSDISQAMAIMSWSNHITYPRMTYDSGLHRYLLTFTYSYGSTPPQLWRAGAELVIMDAPHPWGPFTFVARGSYFGPSNGYDPAFPIKWISRNGQDLWMIWAANFNGCNRGLKCSGAYGFNYQKLHLALRDTDGGSAARRARASIARAARAVSSGPPPPPAAWRNLPATPPRIQRPAPRR